MTTGEEAGGIVLIGNSNTVEISGTVSATGTNTCALASHQAMVTALF